MKEQWVKALKKLFHAQELWRMQHPDGSLGGDSLLLSTMSASQRSKYKRKQAQQGGGKLGGVKEGLLAGEASAPMVPRERRKTLSLAVGAEYRLLIPQSIHAAASLDSRVVGEYGAGDIVKASDLGFANDLTRIMVRACCGVSACPHVCMSACPRARDLPSWAVLCRNFEVDLLKPTSSGHWCGADLSQLPQVGSGWITFGPAFLEVIGANAFSESAPRPAKSRESRAIDSVYARSAL
eukprot:SAG11_NODE_9455_length_910_cov_0.955610_1_plen_237_part_01